MRIASKQLRQIILEELIREAMSDDDDTVGPTSDILSKTYGGSGPVDDFGDSEEWVETEEEVEAAFDKVYGHVRGTVRIGYEDKLLDPRTEALIIRQVEASSRDSLISGPDFPIYPNAYDILDAIDPGRLMQHIQKVATTGLPGAAQIASAWLKYLNENKADAKAILHKAIYETLKHAADMGRIAMNDQKANMRWDVQEFYALPSGDINESRRRRR